MKSQRNKTIILSNEQEDAYIKHCLTEKELMKVPSFIDSVIYGDTFSIMPKLGTGFADLLVADPPYNLNKDFDNNQFKSKSSSEYRKYTESWLLPALALLKNTASIYVCCDYKSSLIIGDILSQHLIVRNRITWQREKGRGAKKNYKNAMEDIWFATVSDDYIFNLDAVKLRRRVIAPYRENGKPKDWHETKKGNFRDTCPSNFWDDISVPFWSMAENTSHPTQKPEKLMAKLILASTNEGDIVFDPFLGSGTTAVTAKKLNRHFVGIEKSKRYSALSQYRLAKADEDKRIQGYEDNVFWERNTQK
ncbi:MAG TPA: site-specific DNA-methyltransferase [Oscillospiraceae bacterium]|nr:site-specific DNA-methyltransferase [Oscillospiraceae bacterium]